MLNNQPRGRPRTDKKGKNGAPRAHESEDVEGFNDDIVQIVCWKAEAYAALGRWSDAAKIYQSKYIHVYFEKDEFPDVSFFSIKLSYLALKE